jgi:tRNA(Ile)-lysidine synthase
MTTAGHRVTIDLPDVPGDLIARVHRAIREEEMLRAGARVGVGVSAGADSVALLRLLEELSGELGVRLVVLHFNHRLRGAESDADESFVEQLAASRGIEFLAGREDVAAIARARGWNLEDAARRLRYAFFASTVRSGRVTRVAVAHTADDQAETVLARLVRGTGPAGLASIYPIKGHVVRPLLQIRRSELRSYLCALGQNWREDPSNLDVTRLRARLRHQVLPLLERELQPAIVEHLCRLAKMAREDESFWIALVAERMSSLTRTENGRVGIRCADLLAPAGFLPSAASAAQRALAQRLVRAMVASLPGAPRQLTARHVAQVLRLAEKSQSGRRTEIPGAIAERIFDWIWVEAASGSANLETNLPSGESKVVSSAARGFSRMVELGQAGEDTTVAVPEIGRRLHLKVIDWSPQARETCSGDAAIDGELLRSPLTLRSWCPGDSFRPQGRRHPLKLKQFLREGRVALRERRGWPVLTSAGNVVWTRGLPVAAEFSPGKTTRIGVLIAEEAL